MDERARLGLIAAVLLGYAGLSHYLTAQAADSAWSLLAILGPMALLALVGFWRSGQRWLAVALALGIAALTWRLQRGGDFDPTWLYLAQHAGIHAALGVAFGRTLRPGRQPLISAMAERVHRGLPPGMAEYTRRVTAVWTAYFFGMALTSLGLFAFAPLEIWSLFANVVTPVAMCALFVGEYILRYRLHPEFERVSLVTAIRAYSEHQQRREAAAPVSGEAGRRSEP
ncbi:MAG: hypothetical protein KGL99_02170 [Burkholderiales bacterium]|nr:hypothetical protein [Burkholderiales bacterium]